MSNDPNLPNPNPNDPPAPPPEDPNKIALEKARKDAADNAQRVKDLEDELERKKTQGLRDKEDWKTLAEQNEQKANDYRTKYEGLNKSLVDREKNAKLREFAVKAGIRPESLSDLELLDFDELSVETTNNGKIIVNGADQAIEGLKKIRPHWFGTQAPSINPSTPETLSAPNGAITVQILDTLQKEYAKDPGNPEKKKAYQEAIIKFKTQT